MLNGVLSILKPKGITSHDAVQHIRRITGETKVGHTGTLDPMAEGVLVLCLGRATRISQYLSALDKEYTTIVRLGQRSDTGDADGTLSDLVPVHHSTEKIEQELNEFIGDIEQTPPMYSAVKVNGKRLYQLARKGHIVERKSRVVRIYDARVLRYDTPDVTIRVSCSKGTYIRTLAADLGDRLGCGAHVAALTRNRVGIFSEETALMMADVRDLNERGILIDHLVSMNEALGHIPGIRIDEQDVRRIEHGAPVSIEDSQKDKPEQESHGTVRILDRENELIGLGRLESKSALAPLTLYPVRVFRLQEAS